MKSGNVVTPRPRSNPKCRIGGDVGVYDVGVYGSDRLERVWEHIVRVVAIVPVSPSAGGVLLSDPLEENRESVM